MGIGGEGGHVIVLRLRTTVSTKIAVLYVATPYLIDGCRQICDDHSLVVDILTSNSAVFLRRDFHSSDDLKFG
jgi:hypothetical protein